jgi:hypothetical protein
MAEWQDEFVDWATRFSFYDFARLIRRWLLAADPDGAHRDHEASRENRHVKYSQLGAGYMLSAEGDALTGEKIHEVLTRRTEDEYRKDLAAREAMWGDDAANHPLPRTARQRHYDAFVSIFLDGGDGTPLVVIHTNEAAVDRALGIHTEHARETSDAQGGAAADADDSSGAARTEPTAATCDRPRDPEPGAQYRQTRG